MSIDRPWLAAGALAALAALWLAMLLLGAGDGDREVLMALHAGDEPWLALAAMGFTYLGNWPTLVVVTILGAGWLAYRRKRRAALVLLIASFSGRLLVIVEKAYFARLRPEEHMRLAEVHYQSFPSGHSANSMIVYLGLALLAFDDPQHRRWAVAGALLLSFLIGVSRPMLGVHWPSDVVAGWSFGLFWTLLVLSIAQRWGPLRAAAPTRRARNA
jgi:undecaprenyl-diphosphatase